jgi:hypothetical protein
MSEPHAAAPGFGAVVGNLASTIAAKLARFGEQYQPAPPPDLGQTFRVRRSSSMNLQRLAALDSGPGGQADDQQHSDGHDQTLGRRRPQPSRCPPIQMSGSLAICSARHRWGGAQPQLQSSASHAMPASSSLPGAKLAAAVPPQSTTRADTRNMTGGTEAHEEFHSVGDEAPANLHPIRTNQSIEECAAALAQHSSCTGALGCLSHRAPSAEH